MRYIVEIFPILAQPNLISILVRTVLAIICAGLIGYDRHTHGAPAGLRTHILVCVGAMIAMSTGQYTSLVFGSADITRIGAQVVSGIGFLGAGSIIVTRSNHIAGLTTAAGLWASACIGLALGVGFYEGALVGTVAVYFTESIIRGWSKSLKKNKGNFYKDDDKEIKSSED